MMQLRSIAIKPRLCKAALCEQHAMLLAADCPAETQTHQTAATHALPAFY
jgi:hypothetical protein